VIVQSAPGEQTLTFDQPVEYFLIDPDNKLLIELVKADNGLRRQPDLFSWLTVFSRLVYRLQDWLLIFGGL
jgi:hypothetical protein